MTGIYKALLIKRIFLLINIYCLCFVALAKETSNRLFDLPLDQLLQIDINKLINTPVNSAAKTKQPLFKTNSAIFVVSQTDIKRIGARTIPDALKIVPGIHVVRGDASSWEVSSRGFGVGQFANKLLVLVDGRSIYTATAGSVDWLLNDVLLEDVQRIEVIRGPGTALWGANAMNGVINIITKSSKDTQGGYFEAGGGNLGQEISLRYGLQLQDNLHLRIYDKQRWGDDFDSEDRKWRINQQGFRLDYEITDKDLFTLQADHWSAKLQELDKFWTFPQKTKAQGGNILMRLTSKHSAESETSYQLYYDRQEFFSLHHIRRTGDLDIQHTFEPNGKHQFITGINARYTNGDYEISPEYPSFYEGEDNYMISAFLQDTISINENLQFTIGTKLEYNSYTDLEFQPNARLVYSQDSWSLWAGYSRAAKTPSDLENDSFLIVYPGIGLRAENLDSEYLDSYEIGYRKKISETCSFDSTIFYNDYSDLRSLDQTNLSLTTDEKLNSLYSSTLQAEYGNGTRATVFGGEVSFNWLMKDYWHIHGSYSFSKFDLDGEPSIETEDDHPEHMASLQSYIDLTKDLQWNVMLYYYDVVSGKNAPSNVRLDTSLSYRLNNKIELYGNFKNLLNNDVQETDSIVNPISFEVPRSFYFGLRVMF